MNQIILMSELNDGWAHLVALSSGERIIISWEEEEEEEDRVDFRFYRDNVKDRESHCELENPIEGEFTFKDVYADEDYPKDKSAYKLIYMCSPSEYNRMGIGEYILRWFLESKSNCKYVYASDPFDVTIKDGSEVIGTGVTFLKKMQGLGLIKDLYN